MTHAIHSRSNALHIRRVKRTGYCGVKIDFPRPLKVEGYEGLELRVRTDGRNYVTNLGVSTCKNQNSNPVRRCGVDCPSTCRLIIAH